MMGLFPPPVITLTSVFSEMPAELRRPVVTEWSRANKRGQVVDSFIEGPCHDSHGRLFVTDIPHGRVFRVEGDEWHCVADYDGEPNGLALAPDGRLFITDYKNGILALDTESGYIEPVLARCNSERFKGVNDLTFARNGDLYFTDQGQTGLHDPTGRVFRLTRNGRLDCLIANGPSPNGLALSPEEDVLFVAMTRDNAVWRVPLLPQGGTAKVHRFASFHGATGPDGMAVDARGNLLVAHAGLGHVLVLGAQGQLVAALRSCRGSFTTNVAFRPEGGVVITDSTTGTILQAAWDHPAATSGEHSA
ncbi:SMP-30/gluconolactonase/LRE family protein [Teichococcus oryzae]|uniref:SMP-30/gluconolactonase/LRE family protein n=1 Tax=Teichococcus oryzae TaxID=1608942 RepID=A0A5B2TCC4_9PROT|nr:SMP-30/gluconolactonase/LRE family protein [Pseudoroseomonas oryzae]KAA2212166.1 SMP-30/gluconolactonase/LRE family protein [Pseudoroseomonas oryzae]